MKSSAILLVVIAACAGNGAPVDEKIAAVDIPYDNSSAGLLSSNVQAAIDDLAAVSASHEQRLGSQVIVCRFATQTFRVPSGIVPHVFTSAECGGTLPDERYIGALSKVRTCSSSLEGIEVTGAGEIDGPGIVLRKGYYNSTVECTGPAELSAIYYRRD